MAKIFVTFVALLATALAEPPVGSYLPPTRNAQPSSTYGAPDASDFGARAPSKTYGPPSNALDVYSGGNAQAPSSRYGAPSMGFSAPSNTYGVPEQSHNGFEADSVAIDAASRFTSNNGAHQPSNTYGAPAPRFGQPSQTYGAPARNSFSSSARFNQRSGSFNSAARSSHLSSTYGAPSRSPQPSSTYGAPLRSAQPSSTYGAPNSFGGAAQRGGFGSSNRYTSAITSSYNSQSNGFNRASSSIPSTTYGAPSNGFSRSSYSAPSTSYSAPSNNFDAGYARQPSSEYGAPGYARKATTEDPLAEPANYEYNYEVRDENQGFGAEFGHQESREYESARGVYHVLLPDGRMQVVEYEADENGYRPNIRYEETGGYPAARSGHGGY